MSHPEHLLIDADKFKYYTDKSGDVVAHKCIPKGDDKYAHILSQILLNLKEILHGKNVWNESLVE